MNPNEFDVIIIGGGITGAGMQRDCAMRGLRTLLIERSDIATGATGRNHGLLHSGARYAVNDPESAEECIRENQILRRIAAHCIDETDGLFITLPEDDLGYQQTFVDACCGISGTYGFKKENYETSQVIGEALFSQIRALSPDAVACDCETCKWQIEMSTGFPVLNPISILAEAIE